MVAGFLRNHVYTIVTDMACFQSELRNALIDFRRSEGHFADMVGCAFFCFTSCSLRFFYVFIQILQNSFLFLHFLLYLCRRFCEHTIL